MKNIIIILICSVLLLSCAQRKMIDTAKQTTVELYLPSDVEQSFSALQPADTLAAFTDKEGVRHSIGRNRIDEKTGEQLLTVGLQEVKVTARFKNVAERNGRVHLEFLLNIPSELQNDNWELYLVPVVTTNSRLPGITLSGDNFISKQNRQYEYYNSLTKVILPEDDDRFTDREKFEKYLARHNREVMRSAKLDYRKTIRRNIFSLQTKADTAFFVDNFMNKKLVGRNEYFKRVLDENFHRIVTLARRSHLCASLKANPGGSTPYTYSADIQATELTNRININLYAEIRTLNGDIYPVKASDSLTFVVSTLRSFAKERRDAPAEYSKGVALLKEGHYADALEILRPFADENTAICYLASGYNLIAAKILTGLSDTSDNLYLKAVASCRLGEKENAVHFYEKSVEKDPSKRWRGNLDPEISTLLKEAGINNDNY